MRSEVLLPNFPDKVTFSQHHLSSPVISFLPHFCHLTIFVFFMGHKQLKLLILDWTRHNGLEQGKKFPHEAATSFCCTWNSYSQRSLPSRWIISLISHSSYLLRFFMAISKMVSLLTDWERKQICSLNDTMYLFAVPGTFSCQVPILPIQLI